MSLVTSPLARWLIGGILAAALVGTLYGLWQHEAGKAERYRLELSAERSGRIAAEQRTATLERASTERVIDNREVTNMAKGIEDAIDKAAVREPASPIGAATLGANCERLRRIGQTATARYRSECG